MGALKVKIPWKHMQEVGTLMPLPKIESNFELDHSSNCFILQAQESWVAQHHTAS